MYIFSKTDSEITHSKKRAQKRTQKWAHVVVSCSNNCFLFKQRAHEGAAREPPGIGIGCCLSQGGHHFCWTISWSRFFTQNSNFGWKITPKWTQTEVYGELLFRKSVKMKKCVWTAPARTDCIWAHPLERSGWPTKWRKKKTYFRTALFSKKNGNVQKKDSKRSPKGWVNFRGGASWGTFGAPSWFLV